MNVLSDPHLVAPLALDEADPNEIFWWVRSSFRIIAHEQAARLERVTVDRRTYDLITRAIEDLGGPTFPANVTGPPQIFGVRITIKDKP
jgi:hypothetical protein